jgi:hypothetical protein
VTNVLQMSFAPIVSLSFLYMFRFSFLCLNSFSPVFGRRRGHPIFRGNDEDFILLLLMNSDERIANVFRSYREPLSTASLRQNLSLGIISLFLSSHQAAQSIRLYRLVAPCDNSSTLYGLCLNGYFVTHSAPSHLTPNAKHQTPSTKP